MMAKLVALVVGQKDTFQIETHIQMKFDHKLAAAAAVKKIRKVKWHLNQEKVSLPAYVVIAQL